jgi:hypothetical protein
LLSKDNFQERECAVPVLAQLPKPHWMKWPSRQILMSCYSAASIDVSP